MATLVAACAAETPDSEGLSAQALQSCTGPSELGRAIARAASSGPSTVRPLATSLHNRVVGPPIVGGEAFARAATELIATAKTRVMITSFIIDDGFIAGRVRDAIAALPEGVEVYVLVNTDRAAWVEGDATSTIHRVEAILNPGHRPRVTVGAWTAPDAQGSLLKPGLGLAINHDKAIVVDSERAIIGNINMEAHADPVSVNADGDWYQVAVGVDGDIAKQIESEMTGAWQHHTFVDAASPPLNMALPALRPAADGACTPMLPLGRAAGEGDGASANRGFVALFTSARRTLRLITPDLNAPAARSALAAASKNADVRIIVSKGFLDSREALLGGTNAKNVATLAAQASQLGDPCKLHVRWYGSPEHPGLPVVGDGRRASHAKLATADGQATIVGSQNMDVQSWANSQELNVLIDDAATTRVFDAEFDRAWARSADALTDACAHSPPPR